MRDARWPNLHLAVGAVTLALSGCVLAVPVPLPAEQQSTRYDSLPGVQPGVTATELESRYGPAALKCADESLWVYGWSVGHGALVSPFMPGVMGRMYYTLHVAFLWFDAEQRLVRLDMPEATQTDIGSLSKQTCTVDRTCIVPNWTQREGPVDRSWACSGPLNMCVTYVLARDPVVESGGKILTCTPADYTPLPTPEPPCSTP